MKLVQSLAFSYALAVPFENPVEYASDFGVYFVDCEEYFIDGAPLYADFNQVLVPEQCTHIYYIHHI